MNLRVVLPLIVAALLVLFTVQNYEVVELRLLFWKIEMSRAIMILAVLAAGVVLGWLARSFKV